MERILKSELHLGHRQIAKKLTMGESMDRDAQFQMVQHYKCEFLEQGFPVLSIDTKKKELLGKFHRRGPAWTNADVRAWDHDFPSYRWGKVIPFGVYDFARNEALMYLAQGFDTGQLAVDAIRRWWYRLGKWSYPSDSPILILADCGGSNGYRLIGRGARAKGMHDHHGLAKAAWHEEVGRTLYLFTRVNTQECDAEQVNHDDQAVQPVKGSD